MLKLSFFFALIFISIVSFAQPNFTGNWEMVKSKSKLNAEFSMAPSQLVITQTENELIVEKHSSFQGESFTTKSNYTLDGKECINDGWQNTKIKSTTVWSADKKALEISSTISMMDGGEMTIVEAYQLIDKDLKVISKATSSFGVMEETWSFEKK